MIEIKNLTKIYHTEKEGSIALKNISIRFPQKGFVALTGQSGSGKTTLLQVLGGFLPFEEGEMFIDGVNVYDYTEDDWNNYQRKDIGFIFQNYGLIETYSVLDNIIITLLVLGKNKKEAKDIALKYLEKVDLLDQKDKKVINLSSGQKQRLSIARALAKEPKIILCDEPTANLDPNNCVEIMALLSKISEDRLVIVSTHNYEDAKDFANYFVRLYNGDLISFDVLKVTDGNLNTNEFTHGKTKIFRTHLTYFKNRIFRHLLFVIFNVIFFLTMLLSFSIFISNQNDLLENQISQDTFNNINNDEILIMKNDKEEISKEDYELILTNPYITRYDNYALAGEINYYYRENIDYRYDVTTNVDPMGNTSSVYTLNKINKSLYINSTTGQIDQSDLELGSLASGVLEVVAPKGYQIGQKITVYFDDSVSLGSNGFYFDFSVSGILKDEKDFNLYFSDEFVKQLDFMIYRSKNQLVFQVNYTDKSRFNRNNYNDILPIYDGSLEGNKVILYTLYAETLETRFFYSQINQVSIVDSVNNERYVVDYDSPFVRQTNLSAGIIIVGKDIYDQYIAGYNVETGRIYIADYAYLKEVITYLNELGYQVLSPYLSSSFTVDNNLKRSKSTIMITTISLIVVLMSITIFINYLFSNSNNKEFQLLSLQGLSKNSARKIYSISYILITVLSTIISIIIYSFVSKNIRFLGFNYKYIRPYHIIIVLVIFIISMIISLLLYFKKINKLFSKKVVN